MNGRRRQHGFTLIELLVVVSLIVLLVALLMPALGRVRDSARQINCESNLRQMSSGNADYSVDFNGWYVPLSMPPALDAVGWGTRWMQNERYQSQFGAYNDPNVWWGLSVWPRGMLCPSQPVENQNAEWNMWRVYAFNRTGIAFNDPVAYYMGYRRSTISKPASLVQIIDGSDWHTQQSRADPIAWWDIYGENFGTNQWQMVAYRHNEGASVAYFDSHIEHRAKEQVYTGTSADAAWWQF